MEGSVNFIGSDWTVNEGSWIIHFPICRHCSIEIYNGDRWTPTIPLCLSSQLGWVVASGGTSKFVKINPKSIILQCTLIVNSLILYNVVNIDTYRFITMHIHNANDIVNHLLIDWYFCWFINGLAGLKLIWEFKLQIFYHWRYWNYHCRHYQYHCYDCYNYH